ncbi:MAG: DUF1684 domain-containing protein [Leucobacter sp.]
MSTHNNTTFAAEHAKWHAELERQRVSPHGPLSITALYWLDDNAKSLPDLPGLWSAASDGTVTVHFEASDNVTLSGEVLDGETIIGPLKGIDDEMLTWGEKIIEIAARSERIAVRPHDPASPNRANYTGTEIFPPNPEWVITAQFERLPRTAVEVDTAVSWGKQHRDSPGRAVFEVDGKQLALTLFGNYEEDKMQARFTDETALDLTFPKVRWVGAVRGEGDTVILDFNRSTNSPLAYSESATCPFGPPENRLPVRVEAGELRPGASLNSSDSAGE